MKTRSWEERFFVSLLAWSFFSARSSFIFHWGVLNSFVGGYVALAGINEINEILFINDTKSTLHTRLGGETRLGKGNGF